jgi:hypothetical protein
MHVESKMRSLQQFQPSNQQSIELTVIYMKGPKKLYMKGPKTVKTYMYYSYERLYSRFSRPELLLFFQVAPQLYS